LRNSFSIEAVIVGRNDEYEPNWESNLFSAIAYNRRLFEKTNVDYRVAFVEWNPLSERPLLAPRLTAAFPFVRGIVVDPKVHAHICRSAELPIVLTFAFNAGFRTTSADFCLGTCGDIFLGSRVVDRIVHEGLQERCLYRAERVSIRNDLQFSGASPEVIEDPTNIVHVDTCTEPPYDRPPYTNASGDFSMVDTGTMFGIRGYDEGVKNARLHIDARFGLTAMSVIDDCKLLGRVFHVSHASSHGSGQQRTLGQIYDHTANLPYANPRTWGLASYGWKSIGERLYGVSMPSLWRRKNLPNAALRAARAEGERIAAQIAGIRASAQPERPTVPATVETSLIPNVTPVLAEWGSAVETNENTISVKTGSQQWAYACTLQVHPNQVLNPSRYHWVAVRLAVTHGAFGVGLLRGQEIVHERFATKDETTSEIFLPLDESLPGWIVLRNAAEDGVSSIATIETAQIVSQPKLG